MLILAMLIEHGFLPVAVALPSHQAPFKFLKPRNVAVEQVDIWVPSSAYTVLPSLQASKETRLLLGGGRKGEGR